ncbi:E3 ubiquitin/ISG15 ligase TRIM25-like [Mytilus californianus]|uniref:E3 ubiquitin/ISG15 ligase TRIM25-like n=1 Tax=Mytilus californianus TaxID=6549 RepID=UPI0022459308|nr:E3 ubiquitin/ISG15 ligase TRIM25-like [Mytilus californianus]
MASNWSLCGVCDNRQMKKSSVVWCSECDEGLCGDCKKHHSISIGTKNHETVSIAEYKKLPTEVLQIAQVCKQHNEKYELFCRKHHSPCCKKCVKSHNDCKGLTDIDELIKNVKTSNAFYEIEQTLLEVAENVKRLSANRKENLNSLKDKKREIEAEIKQARTKINHHLDKLQDDLIKELMTVEQKESSKIEKLLTTLKKKEKEISEVQENIASIKQHASELQTFLTMKDIEKDIAVEEKFIQSLTTRDTSNQVNISCQINKSLLQITCTANVQKFGEIIVSSDPCDFTIQKRKNRQAQIMVALPTRNIDDLTLTLQKRINTDFSLVRGCSLLPGGRMAYQITYCIDLENLLH